MLDEDLSEATNVVRFPSGRSGRPLMERVRDAEPDVREGLFAADSLGLAMPAADLRDRVDAETARRIAEQVLPLAPAERRLALNGLLAPVAAALRDVEQARRAGGHWMGPLEERAETLALEAGRLLMAAHERCQEAHGIARAVGLARRGETWTPYGAAETTAWLAKDGMAQGA